MVAYDKQKDHPEVQEIKDICQTMPNSNQAKDVCNVVNNDQPKPKLKDKQKK